MFCKLTFRIHLFQNRDLKGSLRNTVNKHVKGFLKATISIKLILLILN